jgi:TolB protein
MKTMPQISRRIFLAFAVDRNSAQAQLSIEITGAGANRIPVAIANFSGDTAASRVVTATVRADLERSGLFKLIDTAGRRSTKIRRSITADWKGRAPTRWLPAA